MNAITKSAVLLLLLFSFACVSIKLVPREETEAQAPAKQSTEKKENSAPKIRWVPKCQECLVVPKSGLHRDLRRGYYFDQEEMRCKEITYSTGPGCVPPPFETLQECLNCCGR
ncbi:hypothetical protein INQ51_03580 [Maribellus sp. CM-23]|uniref:BPTI/Kunitz-type proteinase inhibitor domain-containing protein n=1 Tax=Maribellus sp. CM-23 TaxID=2781026 RepID=UPI001F3D6861|nr:BPTI/Kunitz-type proteinase inhibitor domain-containing protein [Maribellus sp. CM-23]MCE4563383.1 hypothetical protein [Maribellus sp. CM-23]